MGSEPFGVCAATGTDCPGSSDALSLLRSPLGVPGRFCPFLALLGAEEASLPFSLLRALGAFWSLAAQWCQMGGVGVQPPIPQSNRALGGLHAAQPGAPGGPRLPQPGAGSTLLKPGVSRAPWGDPTPPPHLGCTPEPICGAGERQQSGWERSALSCVLSALFSLPLVTTGRRQLRSGPHRRPTAAPLAPEGPRADRCAPTSVWGGGRAEMWALLRVQRLLPPPPVPSTTQRCLRVQLLVPQRGALMCNLQAVNEPPVTPDPPGPSL